MQKKKIAVLGGGVAALSTVYSLTSEPGWSDHYEITVYQLGWRLGGKGATGRDLSFGNRLVEHGYHAWFGFYENAFTMIRSCYEELGRPPGSPLSTWTEAFMPLNRIVLNQEFNGKRCPWVLDLPTNPNTPGDGLPMPPIWDYLIEALEVAATLVRDFTGGIAPEPFPTPPVPALALEKLLQHLEAFDPAFLMLRCVELLKGTRTPMHTKDAVPDGHPLVRRVLDAAVAAVHALLRDSVDTNLDAYRVWIGVEFIVKNISGILRDELLTRGFDSINDQNYPDWFASLGVSELTRKSALVESTYASCFAFPTRMNPAIEAGTVLRGAIRQLLLFKGSSLFEFAAGCGDTVFAPLYLVLKRRGVNFELFSKVKEIRSSDGMVVDQIVLERQVDLKNGSYDPLVDVDGLPCWPNTPLYDQLVQGEALEAAGANLESYWTNWRGEERTLELHEHFDRVVCAISIGALGPLTPTLAAKSPPFAAMLKNVATVRTQAIQLWMQKSSAELGWTYGDALLSCDGRPMDTIADMSFLLARESWPAEHSPRSLFYMCGAIGNFHLPDVTDPTDTGYPDRAHEFVVRSANNWATGPFQAGQPARFESLFPNMYLEDESVDWDVFTDPAGRSGSARLEAQLCKANIDPSERYVLSLPGTSKFRLRTDQSGFSNLYLAGDWTQCGINAGCMEAAVISGLMAARAISGLPRTIPGEDDSILGLRPLE
jgi:uncharacterized protein with NAD-binding domain and iron-sulfur cluster